MTSSLPLRRTPAGRFADWLLNWPARDHWRRYVLGSAVSLFGLWAAALVFLQTAPPKYTSNWTLILPGATASANVSLDSIGQASPVVSSPFASSTLSPKVIYKAIAESDRVRGLAARSLDMPFGEFGMPRITLIEQTALINLTMTGRSPEEAQAKANALNHALEEQLDALRKDEIARRAAAVQDSLRDYDTSLQAARQHILDFQQATGLVSTKQFDELALSIEELKRKLANQHAVLAGSEAQHQGLVENLDLSPDLAAKALMIQADPAFAELVREHAEATTMLANRLSRFGPNHPQVVAERARQQAALSGMLAIAGHVLPDASPDLLRRLGLVDSPARAELFQQLVRESAELDGTRQEVAVLEGELQQLEANLSQRSRQAAHLEDLQRDHLVAEAVFTSAIARVDTNRADIYASYPMVQMLAEPNLPPSPSSPRKGLVLAGAAAGSLLAMAAWTFAWLRQLFVLRRQKKSLSTGVS